MKKFWSIGLTAATLAALALAQTGGPNKVLKVAKVGGDGGFDYVYADVEGRKLYVPRSGQNSRVTVFNLDTLEPAGTIEKTGGHGVAVAAGHGFNSANPITMFDSKTLAVIKTITVQGSPDGIMADPYNNRIWVLSHQSPNATVIDAKTGDIVGTLDLGGAPEQAQSDGKGTIYVDIEDKDSIAVVDAKALKLTTSYSIEGKGGGCAGLGLDIKNSILFATCRQPSNMVILSAKDGKVITTIPIGGGTDGGGFNAKTMEAFSSNGGTGTLSIVKEKSPTSFELEQDLPTMARAKTMTLDTKTDHVILIAAEYGPAPAPAPGGDTSKKGGGRGRGGPMLPDSFSLIMVGTK